jgi:hypothetical protein
LEQVERETHSNSRGMRVNRMSFRFRSGNLSTRNRNRIWTGASAAWDPQVFSPTKRPSSPRSRMFSLLHPVHFPHCRHSTWLPISVFASNDWFLPKEKGERDHFPQCSQRTCTLLTLPMRHLQAESYGPYIERYREELVGNDVRQQTRPRGPVNGRKRGEGHPHGAAAGTGKGGVRALRAAFVLIFLTLVAAGVWYAVRYFPRSSPAAQTLGSPETATSKRVQLVQSKLDLRVLWAGKWDKNALDPRLV